MASRPLQSILKHLTRLDKADLQFLACEIEALLPSAPEPSAAKQFVAPGHHLEEKVYRNKDGSQRTYVHERWYEKTGHGYKHPSRAVFKGTKAQYLAALADQDEG